MALSTYWLSQNRKDLAERAIVSKRERDATRAQKCLEVDSYHRQLALKSSKYRSLEEVQSLKTPRANEESSTMENLKLAKKERVESRRQKLAHILAVENEQYMNELKTMQKDQREKDPWNICKLKEQIADLQRQRKEGEQNTQKRYMHHMFGSTLSSSSREKDDQLLQKEVSEAWKQRKEELEKLSLEKQQNERERQKTLQLEQLKAMREARETELVQLQEHEELSNFVQGKVNELNVAEAETKKLKNEKQILIEHLESLLSLQKKRETVRDLQRTAFQRMQTMWQPKEKLRRVLVEVQHGLDFDNKLLLTMMGFNKAAAAEDTALALLSLDCVEEVKNKLDMQAAMEKERETEIQLMYNEEASKVMGKKLEQWSLEAIARDEIMSDLFKALAREINARIEFNIEQEKRFIELKKNCLREIDETNGKAKESIKTLEEKQQYYLDQAKRLGEELVVPEEVNVSRPASSYSRTNSIFPD